MPQAAPAAVAPEQSREEMEEAQQRILARCEELSVPTRKRDKVEAEILRVREEAEARIASMRAQASGGGSGAAARRGGALDGAAERERFAANRRELLVNFQQEDRVVRSERRGR